VLNVLITITNLHESLDMACGSYEIDSTELLQRRFKSIFSTDDCCNPVLEWLVKPNIHLSDVDFTPDLVFKALSTIKCNSACGLDVSHIVVHIKTTFNCAIVTSFGALTNIRGQTATFKH